VGGVSFASDDMPPLLDPTALPRVLGRDEARGLGITDRVIEARARSGRWQRVLPRTLLTSDTLLWLDRLDAAVTFAGPGALLSGAAALCDEFDSVRRPESVLVLVPYSFAARSIGWVHVRRVERMPSARLAPGAPRVEVARAVADLCVGMRWADDIRAVVTEAVRRRLCTPEELATAVDAGPRRGSKLVREAVREAAGGAWSAPEARVASLMRGAGLPAFKQNVEIRLPSGHVYIADFLWRRLRAILEIDSKRHHGTPGDRDATDARHIALESLGFSVIHRTPAAIRRDPGLFLDEVTRWLAARARETAG
jgi:very-short-patch-repair endonuclease